MPAPPARRHLGAEVTVPRHITVYARRSVAYLNIDDYVHLRTIWTCNDKLNVHFQPIYYICNEDFPPTDFPSGIPALHSKGYSPLDPVNSASGVHRQTIASEEGQQCGRR
ncbi:hypothetical protein J6590_030739 [Homalodisca vitripennis]|nr:hypothetical protein J6590_030739 [Homalodisca vitripennis]